MRIFYYALLKTMKHLYIHFCTFFTSSFYLSDLEAPFSCDRHQLIEVYDNVSGILNKMPHDRHKALFDMHFIINWSSLSKSFEEQELLKILQICDTFILVILQATHTPKIT